MIIQKFRDYLSVQLINTSGKREYWRWGLYLVLLIALATTCVDLVSGVPISFFEALGYGFLKGGMYVLGIASVALLVAGVKRRFKMRAPITVGMVWIISFLGYLAGFFFLEPYRAYHGHLAYHGSSNGWELLLRFLPVWAVVTFLFIQQCLNRSLEQALLHLDRRVEKKTQVDLPSQSASKPVVHLLTDFGERLKQPINTADILFVHIIEHYAYISIKDQEGVTRIEIKASLNYLKHYLPNPPFAQPHRSFLVNVSHISGIKRQGREAVINLKKSTQKIPVSRYRLPQFISCLGEESKSDQ
jgi:hypothetical protein